MGGLLVGALLNSVALGLIGGLFVGSLPNSKNKEKKLEFVEGGFDYGNSLFNI